MSIVTKLDTHYSNWKDLNTPLAEFVIAASTECSQRLRDSKQQHVLGTGQILRALGTTSHIGFYLMLSHMIPRIVLMWEDTNSRDKKILLLEVFNQILRTRLDLRDRTIVNILNPLQDPNDTQRLQANEVLISQHLAQFQQSLVDDVYITAMLDRDMGDPAVDTPFRINTIKGLVSGARIPSFLSDYHKGTIISEFNDLVLDRTQKKAVHDEVVAALVQIHIEDPGRFLDITLPKFMTALPGRVSENKETRAEDLIEIVFVLEALTKIACTKPCRIESAPVPSNATANYKFRLFDGLQRTLMDKLFRILSIPHQLLYANALLAAMLRSLQMFDKVLAQDEADGNLVPVLSPEIHPYSWFVLELYQKLIVQKQHKEDKLAKLHYMGFSFDLDEDELVNGMFVSLLSRLTTLALRSSQTSSINNFLFIANKRKNLSQVWFLFCNEEPKPLIDSSQQNSEEGPAEKCLVNVLSMSLVAGIRRDRKSVV